MERLTLTLCLVLLTCYVAQALRCNYCKDISESPDCSQPEETECSPSQTFCLSMTMLPPAYGMIRRCATEDDCSTEMPDDLVQAQCCDTDLCN